MELGELQAAHAAAAERLQAARSAMAEIPPEYAGTPEAKRRREALTQAARSEQAARRQLTEATFYRDVATHAERYKSLAPRIQEEVMQWRAPPHPRPDVAIAAQEAPQLAKGWGEFALWNKELVSTPGKWGRDNRAAEFARRLQAERRLAEQAGTAQLAAFDQVYPGVMDIDTQVKDSYHPGGVEEWGAFNQVFALPDRFAALFGSTGERASGAALAALGVPNKAADEDNELAWKQVNATDALLGNIPLGLTYGITGNKQYAPAYMKAYWDDVRRRESAPLYEPRMGQLPVAPRNQTYGLPERAYEYTQDLTRGLGLSDGTRMGLGLGAQLATGMATDAYMPNYDVMRPLQRLRAAGRDAGFAGGLMAAVMGSQMLPQDFREVKQQVSEQQYRQALQSLLD